MVFSRYLTAGAIDDELALRTVSEKSDTFSFRSESGQSESGNN